MISQPANFTERIRHDAERRIEAMRQLLIDARIGSQEELRQSLVAQGIAVTQSTVSRDLRRLGAVRGVNALGEAVYRLPADVEGHHVVPKTAPVSEFVISIQNNGPLVVVRTTPDSAALVARYLDEAQWDGHVLGTIAGDDTVFVVLSNQHALRNSLDFVRGVLLGP